MKAVEKVLAAAELSAAEAAERLKQVGEKRIEGRLDMRRSRQISSCERQIFFWVAS